MEYYKELFFIRKKHSYDLKEIKFHLSEQENIIKYDNIPSTGFKFVNSNLLDPVTGYVFNPVNAIAFKEKIINNNFLINGVCIKPIIFEYINDGCFRAHLYDDVKDDLVEVSTDNKVSLSESNPGSILRNIYDESYYIYLGLVGQYYVGSNGTASIKKKHLVLKTNVVKDVDDETVFLVHHFRYIDYNKDLEKKYVIVNNKDVDKLKIRCYYISNDVIPLCNYIKNNEFQIYKFQYDYPSLLLSKTVKKIFSKDDISLKRNNIEIKYDYVGETSLDLVYNLKYESLDSSKQCFYDVSLKYKIVSKNPDVYLDFEKYNYVVEIDNTKFLLSARILNEVNCYDAFYENGITIFDEYYNVYLYFYKINSYFRSEPIFERAFVSYNKKQEHSLKINKDVKIYKVKYVLNGNKFFNLFEKTFNHRENIASLYINNPDIFEYLKTKKELSYTVLGKGVVRNVNFI